MRILYTALNLSELFGVPVKQIRDWVEDKVLTLVNDKKPLRFSKKVIDVFVNSGRLDEVCPKPAGTRKGVWT